MLVLVDVGHGADAYTNGKYSPPVAGLGIDSDPTVYQGRFREGNFNRLVGKDLVAMLNAAGIKSQLVVTENVDISLAERVRRVNALCKQHGTQNCILISIHANAAGNCSAWTKACGLSVHVCNAASQKSKQLAKLIYDAGAAKGLKGNRCVPASHYWVDNFYIITKTACPAVLSENLFYDNIEDLKFLASPKGRATVVQYHFEAIKTFVAQYHNS